MKDFRTTLTALFLLLTTLLLLGCAQTAPKSTTLLKHQYYGVEPPTNKNDSHEAIGIQMLFPEDGSELTIAEVFELSAYPPNFGWMTSEYLGVPSVCFRLHIEQSLEPGDQFETVREWSERLTVTIDGNAYRGERNLDEAIVISQWVGERDSRFDPEDNVIVPDSSPFDACYPYEPTLGWHVVGIDIATTSLRRLTYDWTFLITGK